MSAIKSKARVLAPVIGDDGKTVTAGDIEMDDARALDYERDGKLDVYERGGQIVIWAGCCGCKDAH